MKKDLYILLPIYVVCMLAMISDYRAIDNLTIGAFTTVLTIAYLVFNAKNSYGILERRAKGCVIFFCIYYTITSLLDFDLGTWLPSFMIYIIVFTPFFLNLYVKGNTALMKRLLIPFLVIWGVFVVLCFITCSEIPDLARMMTSNRSAFIYMLNGGGYPMGYGCAVLVTYFYNILLFNKINNITLKWITVIGIVAMVLTILVINSFVILVSLLIGVAVSTINRISRIGGSKFLTYMIVGLFAIVFYLNVGGILKFLMENTENDFWAKRWTETYEAVILNHNSNHLDTRESVYQISIDGIKDSPIIGNGYKFGNIFEKNKTVGVGNHSTFLDTLAQFGLVGGIPLFLFLLYPLRRAKRDEEDLSYLVPFYVMAFLNPVLRCFHVMLVVYFIIPCIQRIIKTNNKRKI